MKRFDFNRDRTYCAFLLLGLNLTVFACQGSAQGAFQGGDTQGCPDDRPCFNQSQQVGDTVVFQFTAVGGWEFYNVRYAKDGGETQVENKSGHFTLHNVQPNKRYTISVQGCNSHLLGHSTCSPWSDSSVDTKGEQTGTSSLPLRPAPPPKSPGPRPLVVGRLNTGVRSPAPQKQDPIDPREVDRDAAAGKNLAGNDPLLVELRARQPEAGLHGFDIGVGATGNQTEWGPGKQKILDSLSPPDQEGFKVASSYLLDRNRNVTLAAVGAAISQQDRIVATARSLDPDVRYWLGFDIASGIFGNPALGGQGNTATGPGAFKIRDALSAQAQRGFNASVALHLGRHY